VGRAHHLCMELQHDPPRANDYDSFAEVYSAENEVNLRHRTPRELLPDFLQDKSAGAAFLPVLPLLRPAGRLIAAAFPLQRSTRRPVGQG